MPLGRRGCWGAAGPRLFRRTPKIRHRRVGIVASTCGGAHPLAPECGHVFIVLLQERAGGTQAGTLSRQMRTCAPTHESPRCTKQQQALAYSIT